MKHKSIMSTNNSLYMRVAFVGVCYISFPLSFIVSVEDVQFFSLITLITSGLKGSHMCSLLIVTVRYIFTDRSKAVLLLWIIYVMSVLFCYAFMHVCLLVPCGHLQGQGWPLDPLL